MKMKETVKHKDSSFYRLTGNKMFIQIYIESLHMFLACVAGGPSRFQ